MFSLTFVSTLILSVYSKIYFQETFDTDPFLENRWIVSNWKQDTGEAGTIEYSGGVWAVDDRKGIRTTQDARFYSISAKMAETFDNSGKTLAFGFSVKHEQKMDCGGGYAKLLPADTDQSTFNGDAPYSIMFGPDICGYSTKKVHAILNHNGQNLEKSEEVKSPDDEYTHFYLFVINSDDTYEILVDGESKANGNLKDAWTFEKPKTIKDPSQSKPKDWVDEEYMDDPEDQKPNDWDDQPEKISDPEASKPDDWDDDEDGVWEAPLIDNPEFKGEWRPKKIKNPDYKGAWVHPEIDNPDYKEEKDVYKRGTLGVVGIEVWQVKSGTVFSDFIVTDDVSEATAFYQSRKTDIEKEKAAKTAYDESQKPDDEEKPEETADLQEDTTTEKDETKDEL